MSAERTILVTGASGFVGGRLIDALRSRSSTRVRAASRRERGWPDGVEGCVVDDANPATLRAACAGASAVINLASVDERTATQSPAEALRVGPGGTLQLAKAAAEAGVGRFVQVSTYKVYGNNPTGVITEHTPTRPQSVYAIAHRASEDCASAQHPHAVIVRLANGFGYSVDGKGGWDLIINEFCRMAVVQRRISIRSSGMAWRNFIPLSAVVRALAGAVDLTAGIYHLGSRESMRLRDAAELVARSCQASLGFEPEVQLGDAAPSEPGPTLDFRVDKIAAAGIPLDDASAVELGALLQQARTVFAT